MCYQRQVAGKSTACSEACPTGATKSGDRDALISEAKQRLSASPKQYDGRIYGLNEVGGTSVFLLSSIPLEKFGYRGDLPTEELPMLTRRVLAFVPDVVGVGSTLLGGIYWITHRREAVAAAESGKDRSGRNNG
jgi:formate dehydrogenase iron-sulfur subunit